MSKKDKKKNKQDQQFLKDFALINALDLKVMMEEHEQEWEPEKHSDIENYLHYRANLVGR